MTSKNYYYDQLCSDKLKLVYNVGIYTNPEEVDKAFCICRDTLIQEFESECKKITTTTSAFSFLITYSKIVVTDVKAPNEDQKIIEKRLCKNVLSELTKNNLVNSPINEIDVSLSDKLMHLTDSLYTLSQSQYNFYLNDKKGYQLELYENYYVFTLYDTKFASIQKKINKQMKPDYFKGCIGDVHHITEFKTATIEAFGDVARDFYDILFCGNSQESSIYPYKIINLTELYHKFPDNCFLNGLLLRRNNVSLLDSYKHPHSAYRSRYRPILQLCIDGEQTYITTPCLVCESLSEHITNQLPFATLPNEWKNNYKISEFAKKWKDEHGKWLDDEVQKILELNKLIFLRNKKSIDGIKLDSEPSSIDKKMIGEIDFIVINPIKQKVSVIEDKFIKTTFDPASFGNDKDKFTKSEKSYEKQLFIKFEWINNNITHLQNELKKNGFDICISNYAVTCFFITNSRTYYSFFSNYPIISVNDLSKYLIEYQ